MAEPTVARLTGNPGDVFHLKGHALEKHRHDDLAQRLLLLEAKFRELRAEWDEFIAAMAGRPCCDHCNNREGDPDGHDYGDESAHDGPCAECEAEGEASRGCEC